MSEEASPGASAIRAEAAGIARLAAPALALAVALRLALSCAQPWGYFQYDTHDYLLTVERWHADGELKIHKKRAPLYPLALLVSSGIPVPTLVLVPAVQHLIGVGAVFAAGWLAALWFGGRRWIVLGASIPIAVNPILLWYETAVMAESVFVALMVFTALAGTLYYRAPGRWTLIAFLTTIGLTALARPEGKIFLLAAACLPWLVGGLGRSVRLVHGAVALMGACLLWPLAKTSQTGVMPLGGVIHLLPDHARSGEGLGEALRPLRDDVRNRYPGVGRLATSIRKSISAATEDYLRAHPELGRRPSEAEVNALCRDLVREIYRSEWWRLPGVVTEKFLLSFDVEASPSWTPYWLFEEQQESLLRNPERLAQLAPRLFGRAVDSDEDVSAFVREKYHPERLGWLNGWMGFWQRFVLWRPAVSSPHAFPSPLTMAWPYWLLALGMLCCVGRRDPMRPWHCVWVAGLGALWFGIFLTAGIEARFRLAWEPWIPIYSVALIAAALSPLGHRHDRSAEDPRHAARNHSQT